MHRIIAHAVFDLIGQITSLQSAAAVWTAYMDAARHAGFSHGLLAFTSAIRPLPERVIAAEMPDGWATHYESRSYGSVNPVARRSRTDARPFAWRATDWDTALPRMRQFRDDTIGAGLRSGISIPWHGGREDCAIGLCGNIDALHPHDRHTLHFAGVAALQQMEALAAPRVREALLSARERECLTWVAAGKSDWEIGAILSLSEKTVNIYIERAKRKLASTTRTQAVVKALHDGQIAL